MKKLLVLSLLILGQAFPSSDKTSWMQPESFQLSIGMSETEAVRGLEKAGWRTRKGNEAGHLIVDYDESKTMTLTFEAKVLTSIRFELVDFIPEVRKAFSQQRIGLVSRFGEPDRDTEELLIYEDLSPKVYVVLSTNRDSSFGRQGLGFLSIRYFDGE